jgi:type IX secretion system PorP/SprF family membrane protein
MKKIRNFIAHFPSRLESLYNLAIFQLTELQNLRTIEVLSFKKSHFMRKHYLLYFSILSLMLLLNQNAKAQDPVFGQFYTAPTMLNPALNGVFQGQFRVHANYREQWSSVLGSDPFRTIGAGFEWRQNVVHDDYLGISVNALGDQAGMANFATTRGNLGLSFMKQLSGGYRSASQYLVAGGQFGLGQHSLDYGNLWFSKQFDSGTSSVDQTLSTGENFGMGNTDVYVNINAGLLWYALFDDNFSLYAGAALNHINEPNISFLGDQTEMLPRRWVYHVGGEIPFNRQLSLLPAAMLTTQGESMTTIFGGNFRFTNRDWREVALRGGVWGQISNKLADETLLNSLIFVAIIELDRYNIGISYDVNASSVSDITYSRGAFELSFTYTHPTKHREKVICPKY